LREKEEQTLSIQDWGAVGEMAGAIAVIITLVYLAIQIRQNSKQLKQQSFQTWVAASMDLNMATLDPGRAELFTRGFTDSADLSEDSWIAFAYWNIGFMQIAQAIDYMYRSGSLDHSLWASEIDRARLVLGLPGVRQWWDAGGRTQFTSDFVELMEAKNSSMTPFDWKEGKGFVSFSPPDKND
jgi:hypothetical protein